MNNSLYQAILPYLLVLFSILSSGVIGMVIWFYNLNEKHMNSRVNEIEELHGIIETMKSERGKDREKVAVMSERLRGIEQTQKAGFDALATLINDKMENIKELFTEKLNNKRA